MPDSVVPLLESATRRLVRTVDAMADFQFREASLLPGWTRGHVVAHLVLNAEGLAAALEGVREERAVPMYASQEARDGDIETLSGADPGVLRDRLLASTTAIHDAVEELPDGPLLGPDRAHPRQRPDLHGRPGRRDAAARGGDPPRRPGPRLHLGGLAQRLHAPCCSTAAARSTTARPLTAHAVDLDRSWAFGEGDGPTVSGPGAALAWWATGRDPGDGPDQRPRRRTALRRLGEMTESYTGEVKVGGGPQTSASSST